MTASTDGLPFTATAERAGTAWSGRAPGVHDIGQNLTAAAMPPLMGAVITDTGYARGLGIAGCHGRGCTWAPELRPPTCSRIRHTPGGPARTRARHLPRRTLGT